MFFKQFHLESLRHPSYLAGSKATCKVLALDGRRGVKRYFAEVRYQGMRVRYACDTHQCDRHL